MGYEILASIRSGFATVSAAQPPVLIVPGYRGSGADHWQRWLQANLDGARMLEGVEWQAPVLAQWSAAVRRELETMGQPTWLVAHSFGCLAAVHAALQRPDRVAGALLVAPADPDRFSPVGLRRLNEAAARESIAGLLPRGTLSFPSVVVVSRNDPWIGFAKSAYLASTWGGHLVDAGFAGHINSASGYGPWPEIAEHLRTLGRLPRPSRIAAPVSA